MMNSVEILASHTVPGTSARLEIQRVDGRSFQVECTGDASRGVAHGLALNPFGDEADARAVANEMWRIAIRERDASRF